MHDTHVISILTAFEHFKAKHRIKDPFSTLNSSTRVRCYWLRSAKKTALRLS